MEGGTDVRVGSDDDAAVRGLGRDRALDIARPATQPRPTSHLPHATTHHPSRHTGHHYTPHSIPCSSAISYLPILKLYNILENLWLSVNTDHSLIGKMFKHKRALF